MQKYLPITITLILSALLVGGMIYAVNKNTPTSSGSATGETLTSGHMTGASNAKVTVTEFGDYQCPACKATEPAMEQLRSMYKGKSVAFVFKNYPLTTLHQYAYGAALAAEAAYTQGKFWQMHDELYQLSPNLDSANLTKAAQTVGLNMKQFQTDQKSATVKARVDKDIAYGNSLNVSGTPTIYINGQLFTGNNTDPAAFEQVINQDLSQ